MNSKTLSPKQAAFYFFLKNAGFSYDPKTETPRQGRAKCARALAKAERDASALGYTFEWEFENSIPYEDALGDHAYWCDAEKNGEEHEHEIYSCVAYNSEGGVVASLGAIIDPTREYRRVVEAELASEGLPE
jgi:hypothetical protein